MDLQVRSAADPFSTTASIPFHQAITFEVARTARHIEEAWRLVYEAYRDVGFVQTNPYGMHAAPQALGPHCAVILARSGSVPLSTISSIADGEAGLPLDSVYADELDEIRCGGGRLLEIGLFADRRHSFGNSFNNLLELMRYAFWFGQAMGATDYICGIPPRRARLYGHAFGFKPIGAVKSYATVSDNPVQLMHVTMEYIEAWHAKHRATNYFMTNPMSIEAYEDRYDFAPEAMSRSRLKYFLEYKRRQPAAYVAMAGA